MRLTSHIHSLDSHRRGEANNAVQLPVFDRLYWTKDRHVGYHILCLKRGNEKFRSTGELSERKKQNTAKNRQFLVQAKCCVVPLQHIDYALGVMLASITLGKRAIACQ